MNFEQKIENKRKEWKYLIAGLRKDMANIKLLGAIDEIQKFSDPVCFRGYPKKENVCSRFNDETCCGAVTCPLIGLNEQYIKAKKKFDAATISRYQAQTSMLCSKVRE